MSDDDLLSERLCSAVSGKHYRLCEVLLVLKADPDKPSFNGLAAIHLAVGLEFDSVDFLRLLLQYGSNPNVRSVGDGITPVHLSAMLGRSVQLSLLLASGGDPDIVDSNGMTAFDYGWSTHKVKRVLLNHLSNGQGLSSEEEEALSESPIPPRKFIKKSSKHNCDHCSKLRPKEKENLSIAEEATRPHRCHCKRRHNFSHPMSSKLKTWYLSKMTNCKNALMNNLAKSLHTTPENLKNASPFTKMRAKLSPPPETPLEMKNETNDLTKESPLKDDTPIKTCSRQNSGSSICSDASWSTTDSCSSRESGEKLLNMPLRESDLNHLTLENGEVTGLKRTAKLDVTSPNHPYLSSKPSRKSSCSRNSMLDQTLPESMFNPSADIENRESLARHLSALQITKNEILNNQKFRKSSEPPSLQYKNNLFKEKSLNSEVAYGSSFATYESKSSGSDPELPRTPGRCCGSSRRDSSFKTLNRSPLENVSSPEEEKFRSKKCSKTRHQNLTAYQESRHYQSQRPMQVFHCQRSSPETPTIKNCRCESSKENSFESCSRMSSRSKASSKQVKFSQSADSMILDSFNETAFFDSDDEDDFHTPRSNRHEDRKRDRMTHYRTIFNNGCTDDNSEFYQAGEFVLIERRIKPQARLLTNDGDLSTSSVSDWKSCRSNRSGASSNPGSTSFVSARNLSTKSRTPSPPEEEKEVLEISQELALLTNEEIFLKLKQNGCAAGPVTDSTRATYLRILSGLQGVCLKTAAIESQKARLLTKDFSDNRTEFPRLMMQFLSQPSTETLNLEAEEQLMSSLFEDSARNWREGRRKNCFNYLLLDPRVTRNLLHRSKELTDMETFRIFVSAIFYIGKGQNKRPFAHFTQALRASPSSTNQALPEKVAHIRDVWGAGMGVVSLQLFQGCIAAEAYTREALLISALGLNRLTNQRKGDFYGVAASWDEARRQHLGIFLLLKAMRIFLQEGERQIRPADF